MIKWHEETKKLSELKDFEKNPRRISKTDFERLVRDIEQDGYHRRIMINLDGTIIGGHQRKKALLKAGVKKDELIPVLVPDRSLTEEEFARLNIRDNLLFGEFDYEILANEFDTSTLADWGMMIDWEKAENDIEATEPKEDAKIKFITCPHCDKEFPKD